MPKTTPASYATLPFNLNTPAFTAKWDEYTAWRRRMRFPKHKAETVQRHWDALSDVGESAAIETLEMSMRQEWRGIFPERAGGRQPGDLPGGRPFASGKPRKAHWA